jgi:hypothetical protein
VAWDQKLHHAGTIRAQQQARSAAQHDLLTTESAAGAAQQHTGWPQVPDIGHGTWCYLCPGVLCYWIRRLQGMPHIILTRYSSGRPHTTARPHQAAHTPLHTQSCRQNTTEKKQHCRAPRGCRERPTVGHATSHSRTYKHTIKRHHMP